MRNVINRSLGGRIQEDHAKIYLAEILIAIEELHKNGIVQLTVAGVSTEIGQSVLLNVEEELKPEPGRVTTLFQLPAVQIVLERVQNHSLVTYILVQVKFKFCRAAKTNLTSYRLACNR